MKIKNSSELIVKINDSLDDMKALFDASQIEDRIATLSEYKEDMDLSGFNATFPEMYLLAASKDMEVQPDLSKQLKHMREAANMKRYTYNRVKIAMASNRVALNMARRGRMYDIAKHLPYDGAYLKRLIYLGEPAVAAYNYLLKLAAKRPSQQGYIATLMHEGKSINLNIHSDQNIEEKIKKTYGDNAYLVGIKKLISPPLIRFKSMRISISAGYAIQAAEKIYPDLESKSKMHTKEHEAYATELAKKGISKDARVDLMEGHDELKEQLYQKGLMVNDSDSLMLLPEIVSSITKRRSQYSSAVMREAERQFSHDVFHFFITEPRRVRSSLPLYPGISSNIEPEIYEFLNHSGVENSLNLVQEKIKFETVSNIGRPLGPAVVYLSGKSADWCAKEFDVDKEEIEATAKQISSYKGEISDQAKKFLEGLSPKKKEQE